ncbi:MAG: NUDIX hydrolase [Candidatus Binataceae bacterium]|jgi:8-oxo-dGTP diphosphatase
MAEAQFWIGVHGVIERAGEILILRRDRSMIYKPGSWDLPGGHLALDETFEECLMREVGEETSLQVTIGRLLGLNRALDGPYVQIIFACTVNGPDRIELQAGEHDAAQWLPVTALTAMTGLIPYLERIVSRGLLDYLR